MEKIHKKAILLADQERWLEIIKMFYDQFVKSEDPETKRLTKEMMKFCGEQSLDVKERLKKLSTGKV